MRVVVVLAAGFEAVDLAAQAGLAAINAAGVQKHRAAHLAEHAAGPGVSPPRRR